METLYSIGLMHTPFQIQREMHAGFRSAASSLSSLTRATVFQSFFACRQLQRLNMSANVLSSNENLPVGTKHEAAAAMEPPAKQPRLEQPCSLKVKLLNEHATPPKRGSAAAAGYDLCSCEDTVIPARGRKLVKTGIAIHTPPGTYGRVAPRSGLAVNHFIDVGAGVIDEDYRGEVRVLLFNHEAQDFQVNKGDRIAQLVLECIKTPPVDVVDDLDDTDRGAGGFGSTGGYTGTTGAN